MNEMTNGNIGIERTIAVKTFDSVKGLLIMLAFFGVGAIAALVVPFLSKFLTGHATEDSIVFGAVAFFAIPLIAGPVLIKRRCFDQAMISFTKSGFRVEKAGNVTDINWDQIKNYTVRPFKTLMATGFNLKIFYRDGNKFKLIIVDQSIKYG